MFARHLKFAALSVLFTVAAALPLASQAQGADPKPPSMKLGDDVKPLAYSLAVTVVPDQPSFQGHIDIDVQLAKPTQFFWINGTDLQVSRAVLTMGSRTIDATPVAGGEDFIGMRLAQRAGAGRARLSIDYTGTYRERDSRGMFRQRDLGEWYAYTQFEAPNARRAFPCFDEPQWKTPWSISLKVRSTDTAVSNAPLASETDAGGGMKVVRFATSKPLATYFVAFAVGPFDVVDGGTAGINRTPLRFIVPKGRGSQTAFAKEATPRLIELLEQYFGRPYPFEKLDSVAIPVTIAFGAMENPGMITYRSSLMVATPGRENDERFKQVYSGVGAHEMAHQWFGDLVTMQWWTDVWLNESFATWMAGKIVKQYRPDWDVDGRRERERMYAMETDRLSSTRQVRQRVDTPDDLGNAFDSITYQKGGALLAMFEAWLGEERFRDGVRRYLADHAYANASAEDFFAAIAKTDPQVAKAFASFVSQPGVPVIDFLLDCTRARPAVLLQQARFDPAGKFTKGTPQRWTLPVCVRAAGSDKPSCTMMQGRKGRIELAGVSSCPAAIVPNPAGTGYFLSRVVSRGAGPQTLAPAQLSAGEAVAYLDDQSILSQSALLSARDLLAVVAPFTQDARPEVAAAAAHAVDELHPALFAQGKQGAIGPWVMEHFGARATQLGWVPQPGESDTVRNLRTQLVPLVADIGGDAALKAQARKLALAWLAGDRAQAGSGFRAVLRSAARDADAALVDAMIAAASASNDPTIRTEIYSAMGHVRDAVQLQRVFERALADGVDLREAAEIYEGASEEPASAVPLLQFAGAHIDVLMHRLPEESVARFPPRHHLLCSREDRDAMAALYEPRRPGPPGYERNLSQTLEAIDICVKSRAVH